MIRITPELVATYYKEHDNEPASRFDIHKIEIGEKALYMALSQALSEEPDVMEVGPSAGGIEVQSMGTVHTIETRGTVADMTTAMLGQIAFLQLRMTGGADLDHVVRVITSDPEPYYRVFHLLPKTTTADGRTSLEGSVEDVTSGAEELLKPAGYKIMHHTSRPHVVDSYRRMHNLE